MAVIYLAIPSLQRSETEAIAAVTRAAEMAFANGHYPVSPLLLYRGLKPTAFLKESRMDLLRAVLMQGSEEVWHFALGDEGIPSDIKADLRVASDYGVKVVVKDYADIYEDIDEEPGPRVPVPVSGPELPGPTIGSEIPA